MITFHPPHPTGEDKPHAAAVWIDLLNPDAGESRLVEELTGARLPERPDLAEIEPSSRLSVEGGAVRLTAPMIAEANTDHPKLTHIALILTPERLITVHYEPLRMFESTRNEVAGESSPRSSAAVFAALLRCFVASQADLLEGARARLDEISHHVFREHATGHRTIHRSNAVMRDKLRALGALGERISMIRESLLVVDRMAPFVSGATKAWFSAELADQLKVVHEDIDALEQFVEHLLGKVQFLLDAVLGFINIEQNDIFKVLTIASVVGIFPTLMAGWYGMNFHNMPEYNWAHGYQFGIGVIIASTIAPLLWFKWRGWL